MEKYKNEFVGRAFSLADNNPVFYTNFFKIYWLSKENVMYLTDNICIYRTVEGVWKIFL